MPVRTLAWLFVMLCAGPGLAQTPPADIRVTGEHPLAGGDTPELARQLALLDARHKVWQAAIEQLQRRADLKTLRLTPTQLEVYTAVILEPSEEPTPSPDPGAPVRVRLRLGLDAADAVGRMTALRKDQDATRELVEAWTQMQRLRTQLADRAGASPEDRQRMVTRLSVQHLAARAVAALARTEDATVGGRVPSAEGQARAQQLAQEALALLPDSPEAHIVMGDLAVEARDPDAAEAEFRKAVLAADSGASRTRLAEALRLQGKFSDAIAQLREAIRIEPGYARAHSDLGLVLRAEGNVAEAVVEYREALRLDPDSIDAHNGLAVTFAGQKRLDDAVAEFREIVRIDPDSAIGYYNLAYALADLDRDEESAAALREVIRINPNHYNARFNLGELFRLEGKFDESVKQFREYVRLAPDTPQNQRNLQRARSYIEKFQEQ
jgi:tetratricopeptide (TPR) repeat protein